MTQQGQSAWESPGVKEAGLEQDWNCVCVPQVG